MTSGYLRGSNNLLAGASAQGGYTIEESLRFRSSASAYLSWTPASAGNRKTWTWSAWVKRGIISNGTNSRALFNTTGGTGFVSRFDPNDTFQTYDYNGSFQLLVPSTQVFRDPSAWYHFVLKWDTTQATASNRYRLFVNGIDQNVGSTFPAQDYEGFVNSVVQHTIGDPLGVNSTFDGYITEVNFIDGQALDPSSFGEYNATTGVWQPVAYEGTYGTNGFYLPFSDATTTTTLVADSSGKGNDWTPNNISLTAGATYDSMTDTPTSYADGGNYAVLNPLASPTVGAFTEGNLTFTSSSASAWQSAISTIGATSGKWYFEATAVAITGSNLVFVGAAKDPFTNYSNYLGSDANTWGVQYGNGDAPPSIFKYNNNSGSLITAGSIVAGDIIQCAIDLDTGSIWFGKNNTWAEGDPAAGTGASFTNLTGSVHFGVSSVSTGNKLGCNFGQRPFAYTPPTDFLPLHTGNLPDSTIVDGSKYFDVLTYTGTGATQSITGLEFQPDLVWVKCRSIAFNHNLTDTVRGITKKLIPNDTNDETTVATFTSFDSDGFTLSNDNTERQNDSGETYVGWQWKAGTAFSNDAGTNGATIASVGSVNQDAGFSIVSYTANGASAQTIAHGLNTEPSMIITKVKNNSGGNWGVYHKSVGNTKALFLNTTNGTGTSSLYWNNTTPTPSVFSVGLNNTDTNWSTYNFIAYCFSEVPGYSSFGSYTGNSSSDGVFVYLGLRPRFIMLKSTSSGYNWVIYDTERDTYNVASTQLLPNEAWSEATIGSSWLIDVLSNGFKFRVANGDANGSVPYIYMAFAENPFKNSLAR